jgi:hypothetical protein
MLPALLLQLIAAQAGEPLVLEWNAPPACPPAESVKGRLGKLSGTAAATITQQPAGWHIEVRVSERTRELTTRSCEEAGDAAVLIIQLGLAAPAEPIPAPAPEVLPPPPPDPVSALHAQLIGGAELVWLPTPSLRFGASFSLYRASFALTVDLTTGLPSRFAGGPTAKAFVTVQLPIHAQLGGCWIFQPTDSVQAGPCLHAAAGWLLARGENVSSPGVTSVALWSAGPGGRLWLQLGSWVELLAAAVARFGPRPSVSFEGTAPIVEAAAVSVELSAGIGVHF